MIEIVLISSLSVLVVILGFTTFNLMRKNEKQEDILAEYLTYLDRLSKTSSLNFESHTFSNSILAAIKSA